MATSVHQNSITLPDTNQKLELFAARIWKSKEIHFGVYANVSAITADFTILIS